jgi:hypothetical protein
VAASTTPPLTGFCAAYSNGIEASMGAALAQFEAAADSNDSNASIAALSALDNVAVAILAANPPANVAEPATAFHNYTSRLVTAMATYDLATLVELTNEQNKAILSTSLEGLLVNLPMACPSAALPSGPPAQSTQPSQPSQPAQPTQYAAEPEVTSLSNSGQTYTVVATGFQPYEMVTAVLHSAPYFIGTEQADGNGTVTFTWNMPGTIDPGSHRVVLTGTDSGTAETPVTIAATTAKTTADTLSATGGRASGLMIGLGLVSLLAGLGFIVIARRRSPRHVGQTPA